jgi:hypothetical protein
MASNSNPGRRVSIDLDGGLSAGTPGLNDVKKGLVKPSWMGESYKGFEGSFETIESPGMKRKSDLGSEG